MSMKRACLTFKALSDPTRLRIVRLLLERELCVCELTYILGMEQSRVSHQLRILRDAGLVEDDRESRWIIYRMPEAIQRRLRPLLERPFTDDPEAGKTIRKDLAALEACLRNNVRKTRCEA
jgi:ArsR family transcriptional regulator